MELTGQDKKVAMPSSLGYNPPNRESSFKFSSPPTISTVGERRDEADRGRAILSPPQTLDQHHHLHRQHHQLNAQQQQQQQTQRQGRDPNLDPDPVLAPIPVSSATSTPVIHGSYPKTPPPQPPAPAPPPPPPPPPANNGAAIRYRECLKNHAASMGCHIVDGCGEFMPSGEEGTPQALKCAACDCHRSFHRKEIDGESQPVHCYYSYNPNSNSNRRNEMPPPQIPPLQHHHKYSHGFSCSPSMVPIPPMTMAFVGGGGGAPAESSSEDLNAFQSNAGPQATVQPQFKLSKKRFRTKFSQEQKDKMMDFAAKLEWRIQKQDEQQVQQFCSEVGVKRQVFKVWMHNNKQAMKKMQL